MKKIEEQDEIMNKIQKKIDKDIERMNSKKAMDKSVEKQIRKQLLDLYLFQSENNKKLEKQRKQNKTNSLSENVEKNAKKQQKNAKKTAKNAIFLSKNESQQKYTGEKDFYSLTIWKTMSQELRKEHEICQLCGKRKSEEVHHIFPFMHQFEDIREEVFFDKDNLICLCSDCHHQVHAKNYGTLGIPERTKIENLRSQISRKYLNQGKILSWL